MPAFPGGRAAVPRLKAALWVDAEIRRCRAHGIDAYLVRRGDEHAGAILIKHNRCAAGHIVADRVVPDCIVADCIVYVPANAPDGGRAWRRGTGDAPVTEAAADAYIARQRGYDPDIWVLEIEDPRNAWALAGPVLP